ncbi:MAG TPA: MBL fold metallo-hydrolase [Nitrososphaeraceae archaeon]
MLEYEGINIKWTGHDGFQISNSDKILYIDPFKLAKQYNDLHNANLILITHNHFDHLSLNDLGKIINKETIVIAAKECVDQLKALNIKEVKGVAPGEKINLQNNVVETIPAYNTNKDFHPKRDGKVGFIVTINNVRIYHAGDTDLIPEMKTTKPDIALTPVSGTYVMTAEEASEAVNDLIKPKMAIPMHYNSIVGTREDAVRFSKMVTVCSTKILEQE